MHAASQTQVAVSLGYSVHGLGGWRGLERLRSEAIGTAGPARLARSGWHRWHGVARSRLTWGAPLAWRRSTWIRSEWHGWLGNVWPGVARPRQVRQAWQRIEWCGIARQARQGLALIGKGGWHGDASRHQDRRFTAGTAWPGEDCSGVPLHGFAGMAWHRRPA